jgi:hypothetical protein
MLMRLQLAPHAARLDRHLEEEIESLLRDAESMSQGEIEARLNRLVETGQRFLWKEWRKVKEEAIHGDPYDTLRYRFRAWVKSWD